MNPKNNLPRLAFDVLHLLIFCALTAPALALTQRVYSAAATAGAGSTLLFAALPLFYLVFLAGLIATAKLFFLVVRKPKPGLYDFPAHPECLLWLLRFSVQKVLYLPFFANFALGSVIFRHFMLRALGCDSRFSVDTASSAILLDPYLIRFGEGATVATDALVSGHYVHRKKLLLAEVRLGDGVQISGFAKVFPGVSIGEGTTVGLSSFIGDFAKIGRRCTIGHGVKILRNARVGDGARIGRFSVIEPGAAVADGAVIPPHSVVRAEALA